jgi:hypothetical protein
MKKLILLFALILSVQMATAQRYNLGFGLRAGVTNFLGDIGSGDLSRNFVYNMELDATRFATGPFVTYRFHPMFAVQGSFTYGRLKGEDSKSINRARLGRNLSFTNDIFELAGKFEVYPQVLALSDVGYRGRYRTDFQTYFFAGVGAVIHSPKAEYNGEKYKLRPLMTEGVRYSPVAVVVPFGGGFFFTFRRQHRVGFEMQWSWAFTDYLDDIHDQYVDPSEMNSSNPMAAILANRYSGEGDVPDGINYTPGSKRGDPTDRDNYLFMSVSYQFMIRTRGGFYRSNYSWMYGRHRKWGGTKAKF